MSLPLLSLDSVCKYALLLMLWSPKARFKVETGAAPPQSRMTIPVLICNTVVLYGMRVCNPQHAPDQHVERRWRHNCVGCKSVIGCGLSVGVGFLQGRLGLGFKPTYSHVSILCVYMGEGAASLPSFLPPSLPPPSLPPSTPSLPSFLPSFLPSRKREKKIQKKNGKKNFHFKAMLLHHFTSRCVQEMFLGAAARVRHHKIRPGTRKTHITSNHLRDLQEKMIRYADVLK